MENAEDELSIERKKEPTKKISFWNQSCHGNQSRQAGRTLTKYYVQKELNNEF